MRRGYAQHVERALPPLRLHRQREIDCGQRRYLPYVARERNQLGAHNEHAHPRGEVMVRLTVCSPNQSTPSTVLKRNLPSDAITFIASAKVQYIDSPSKR